MTLTQINKAGLDEIALDHVFTIGASGSSAYTFQGEGLNGTVNNPTLYLTRGKTYRFENGSGGHPIRIQSTSGASGTAYNTGVTNNAGGGTVIVEVQHDAPDVLYYQCTSHAAMNGILYITGALADGGVTTAKIAADAVTNAKIADDAIGNENLQNNSVATANIADSAVTTAKIADNAITGAKMGSGSVGTSQIIDGTVTGAKLGSGSVGTSKIIDGNVTTAKIADDAVTNAKLANSAVNTDQLETGAVTAVKLANNAATTAKIADGNVTAAKLASGVQTTINNNADNRVITGSGTANTLEGESGLLFDSSQRLLLGNSGSRNVGGSTTNSKFQVEGTSTNTSSISLVNNQGSTAAPFVFFGKTRGNSVGESGIVQNGDTLGGLSFIGADGNDTNNRTAEITAKVSGTPANNTIPTSLTFSTSTANAGQLTERMRIDEDGKVGISNNNPTFRLDISDSTSNTVRLNNTSETGHGSHDAKIVAGGVNYHNMRFEASNYYFYGFNGSNTAEHFRIRSTGGVTFNGDTADANALDDYEIGTYSPAFGANGNISGGNGMGLTYTTQAGYYIRIGDFVFCNGILVWTNKSGTLSNHSGIYCTLSIPFAQNNNNNQGAGQLSYNSGLDFNADCNSVHGVGSNSYIYFNRVAQGSGKHSGYVMTNNVSSSGQVNFAYSYRIL